MAADRLRQASATIREQRTLAETATFTVGQLAQFDGSADTPIYMACLGDVFDVTAGHGFYGKGGAYGVFAGKDASRGLGMMRKNQEFIDDPDVSKLTGKQLKTTQQWHARFLKKYPKVGTLVAAPADAAISPPTYTNNTATISVPGLSAALTVLHLSVRSLQSPPNNAPDVPLTFPWLAHNDPKYP